MRAQEITAWIFGIVLVLVGVIGFFNDPMFNIFNVNSLHNWVHILSGGVLIWGASVVNARPVNKTLGIVYILIAIVGFLVPLTFLEISSGADPDNFLHLALGIILALVGWLAD